MNMKTDFVAWINEQLKERNWSQAELARRGHFSTGALSRIMNRERMPGVDICRGVAEAFGMRDVDVMKIAGLASNPSLDEEPPSVREMISKFTRLSDEDQAYMLKIVTALDETEQAQKRRAKKPTLRAAKP